MTFSHSNPTENDDNDVVSKVNNISSLIDEQKRKKNNLALIIENDKKEGFYDSKTSMQTNISPTDGSHGEGMST